MSEDFRFYRMGTSLAGLQHFFILGLPEPQQPFFRDHSVRQPQGLGGEGRHGYLVAMVMWESLNRIQGARVRAQIATVETASGIGNGVLYLTLPRADGSHSGQSWIDVSGRVAMPEFQSVPFGHGILYPNIVLKLNNVTVENDPSTVL